MLVTSGAGLVGSHLHESPIRREESLPHTGDGANGTTVLPDALGSAAGGYAGQRTAWLAACAGGRAPNGFWRMRR
jgi:hypothetical protein